MKFSFLPRCCDSAWRGGGSHIFRWSFVKGYAFILLVQGEGQDSRKDNAPQKPLYFPHTHSPLAQRLAHAPVPHAPPFVRVGPFHNLGLVALVPLSKRWRPGIFQTWRTSATVEGGSTVFNLRPGRGTKPVTSSAFYTIIGESSWISLTYYHAAQVTQQLAISGILVYSFIVLFWSSLSTRY